MTQDFLQKPNYVKKTLPFSEAHFENCCRSVKLACAKHRWKAKCSVSGRNGEMACAFSSLLCYGECSFVGCDVPGRLRLEVPFGGKNEKWRMKKEATLDHCVSTECVNELSNAWFTRERSKQKSCHMPPMQRRQIATLKWQSWRNDIHNTWTSFMEVETQKQCDSHWSLRITRRGKRKKEATLHVPGKSPSPVLM